jgi:hypothetical protein
MQYKLFEFFEGLTDPRRKQGQRHRLEDVLQIVIMAILSGHQGLRGFSRFAMSNEEDLINILDLKHGVPCFFTIRTVIMGLNQELLAQKFTLWLKDYHATDDFMSLDGKAVTGTSTGGKSSSQNFVSVVSAFGHRSGLIFGMKAFENGKSGESEALRQLVERLGMKDKVFTMDALHTQKKLLP